MNELRGHPARSPIHQRAIGAGVRVTREEHLDPDITLVEYAGAEGCYAYFSSLRGCFKIFLPFDEVVKVWADEEIPLRMRRAGVIVLREDSN